MTDALGFVLLGFGCYSQHTKDAHGAVIVAGMVGTREELTRMKHGCAAVRTERSMGPLVFGRSEHL